MELSIIHEKDSTTSAVLLRRLGLGAILSVQRVGVELTVSRARTVRPCGYDANKVLSYFGCGVIEIGDHSGFN